MRAIKRKSLLYRSGVEYGDFCINHVEGCSHGCLYPCYAMLLKRKKYDDWCQPKIVENALELLKKEIPIYKDKILSVHLCFSTDPFMHGHKEVERLSLEIIKQLNISNIPCTLLTKGIFPVDSINELSHNNECGITIVSLSEDFRGTYEPHAAPIKERIGALKHLHTKGFKTWVSIEPYPTPNIINQNLMEILETMSFVDKIVFGRLNYNSTVKAFAREVDFYNSQVNIVADFCRSNKIGFYIKKGTFKNR